MKNLGFAIFLSLVSFVKGAIANDDLGKAFQREYAFLVAQKVSLLKDQSQSKAQHRQMVDRMEAEVKGLEKQLVQATTANDKLYEEVQRMEKDKRDHLASEGSLVSTLKRALKALYDVEQTLKLESPGKFEPVLPARVVFDDFREIKLRSMEALRSSAEISELRTAYKNKAGDLVEGPVVRFGRIAAHALEGKDRKVLGPNGEGLLVELESVNAQSSILPFYLFESLLDKSIVKKRATVLDRIADFMPLLILGLMMALVLSLFIMFARE